MTPHPELEIETGCRVRLHLSLTLEDGTLALSTYDEEPVELTLGDGTLREGMELALLGLKPGDEQTLTLTPDQTYGWHHPELVESLSLDDFPENMSPQPGQIIGFRAPNGEEVAGAVLAVDERTATVDFNHPLAGKDLIYKVSILNVASNPDDLTSHLDEAEAP